MFNWLFNDHVCDHSKCITNKQYHDLLMQQRDLLDSKNKAQNDSNMYQLHYHKISQSYTLVCTEKEKLNKELATYRKQEERQKQIIENLEQYIRMLQNKQKKHKPNVYAFSSKKQKHLKSFEEYLKKRLTEQEIASVKQQAQDEVNRMETETKSVDS